MESSQRVIDWEDVVHFTGKQAIATRAMYKYRYVLYGGSRGPGKSYWLRHATAEFLIDLYKSHGVENAVGMLACETYEVLRDRQIAKIAIEFPEWMGTLSRTDKWGLAFKLHDALGGGVIALRNLDDPSKYKSAEFAIISVDELTKISKETFDILRGSLRWVGVDHTVFLAASNPDGVGNGWVKQLWIRRDFPPEMRDIADQFIYIKALPADNPHLPDTYWQELNSLPQNLRRAWVEGDWDAFLGQAFPEWSESVHVVDMDPEDIPDYFPRKIGIDWGYAKPFAVVWIAIDPDTGRHYLYRELYQDGLSDQQQARLIREYSGNEKIVARYADPSMWTKKNQTGIATSTADIYSAEGCLLKQADNNRLSGKRKVDRLLRSLPDGRPGLVVLRSCKHFIRTFPTLVYSSTNPEDVDTEGEDHLYDALRYALTDLRETVKREKQEVENPFMKLRGI